MRHIRLLLLASVVALAGGATAHAEGSPKEVLPPLLDGYSSAYQKYIGGNDAALDAAKYEYGNKILDYVMRNSNSSYYFESLQIIENAKYATDDAKADLAFALQLEWERQYLFQYYEFQQAQLDRKAIPSRIALDTVALMVPMGFAARGTVAAERAIVNAKRYFKLFASAFALTGGFLAAEASQAGIPVPVPPCSVLSLGIPINLDAIADAEEEKFYRSLKSDAIGLAASTTALIIWGSRALIWGARAAEIGGAAGSLESFGITLVIGIGVDYAARKGAEALLENTAENKVNSALRKALADFDRVKNSRNESAVLAATKKLIGAALQFEAYFNLDALKEMAEQHLEISHERTLAAGNSALAEPKIAQIRDEHLKNIAKALSHRDIEASNEVAEYLVRETLLKTGLTPAEESERRTLRNAVAQMNPSVRQIATRLLDEFEAAYAVTEYASDRDAKLHAFEDFLKNGKDSLRSRAAYNIQARLSSGDAGTDPYPVLFAVAAEILSANNAFIAHYGEQVLMDRVRKYTILYQRLETAK